MGKISNVVVLAFSVLLAGCSAFAPTLDEAGIVEIEISQKDKPPRVYFVHAYRSSGETVIRGRLKYPVWSWYGMFPGHIDLTFSPLHGEKTTLHDVAVIPKRIPKKRGREAFFVGRIATDIPEGTRIIVEYSEKKHDRRS